MLLLLRMILILCVQFMPDLHLACDVFTEHVNCPYLYFRADSVWRRRQPYEYHTDLRARSLCDF